MSTPVASIPLLANAATAFPRQLPNSSAESGSPRISSPGPWFSYCVNRNAFLIDSSDVFLPQWPVHLEAVGIDDLRGPLNRPVALALDLRDVLEEPAIEVPVAELPIVAGVEDERVHRRVDQLPAAKLELPTVQLHCR